MTSKSIGRFHVLTDFHFQQRYSHAELASLAIEGGADCIQFRQKSSGIRHLLAEAKSTALVCRNLKTPLIVDDRVDVALACGADGVHLGQTDIPIADARSVLGPDLIIGGTATNIDQALRSQDEGADYVGFGPVFLTSSKANPASVKGVDMLAAVCERLDVPVIAIGGITARRVAAVFEAGAYGIALMTAVTTATEPADAAGEIRNAIDAALAEQNAARSTLHGPANGRDDTLR